MPTMLFDNIDWSKQYKFTLVLTKKNKKPICILNEAYDRRLERNLDTLDKLSFTIPKYIDDQFTHEQIQNPNYDSVIEENMVLLKCGEPSNPIFESYFIIKGVTETTDKMNKQIECSSREVMLNKNTVTLDGVERQLIKDEVNVSEGIFDILERETTWKLGYIDPEARVEHINGGTNTKYRWFDSLSKPWYQFLQEDVQKAFNVILTYDTVNKKINCYNRDTFGKHTGIILSENNYIKNLNKKTNSEGICTKLICSGRDGLTFNDVNIYGSDWILDYSHFINNGQMSEELIEALVKYDILLNQKDIEFKTVRTQISTIDEQLIVKQGELVALNEELIALKLIQKAYLESNDNVNLPIATTNVNNKVAEIGVKQNEINALQTQLNELNEQLSVIADDIDKKYAKDSNGNLIFNSDLLEELEDFTYTENWSSDYYSDSAILLEEGKKVLRDWCVPPISFEIDSIDFFGCVETQLYWDRLTLGLGDYVRLFSDRLKANNDIRIVGYSYGIDSNDLKISFSNKDKKLDDTRSIGSVMKKANESSKVISTKKLEWNKIKGTKDAVENFLNNALDLGRQQIVSRLGKNKIDISEFGIFVTDASNENNQIALLSGLIAFTNDKWQTCQTAIDGEGIYTKFLVGQIMLSNELYISNEANNVSITKDGIEIRNSSGVTIITPNQINASAITTGTLDANKITVINLNANSINSGSINASQVSISNLNADNINTGTIKVGGHWITANGDIFLDSNGLYNNYGGVNNQFRSMVHTGWGGIDNPAGNSGITITLPSKFRGKHFDVAVMQTGVTFYSDSMTRIYLDLASEPNYANGTFTVYAPSSTSNVSHITFTYIAVA